MIEISNMNDLESLIKKEKFVILELGKDLCSPCKTLKMKIDNYTSDKPYMVARYVPIDLYKEFAASLNVLSAPTVLVYIDHKLTFKENGYFSLELLFDKIERLRKYLED